MVSEKWVRKSSDLQNRPYPSRKIKKISFLRRSQIVHAFSNIPFLDPCHGARTGHGTADSSERNQREICYRSRRMDLQNRPYPSRKIKKISFLRRSQIVHAFLNIPFLDPCHGARTGHGTPDSSIHIRTFEICYRTEVWTSKTRPRSDTKKKIPSKIMDTE